MTQLLFAYGRRLPALQVTDEPRFRWRGVHLDAARHFFDVDEVLRLLDLAALHRLNRFHWHLTDDQGWRIQIRSNPRLTEIGSIRSETKIGHYNDTAAGYDGKPYGGFYTQDDIRRVVARAESLGITVVPEIDLPGHMQAAITAYPHLGNGLHPPHVRTTWGISHQILNAEPSTFTFVEEVLEEVLALFPSPWIHLGGDEAPADEWKQSEPAQSRARALGYQHVDQLQHLYTTHFANWLQQRGRRLIGWDEMYERSGSDLPPGATVMAWRGEEHGIRAAQDGVDVVMTPREPTYLDKYQADSAEEPLAIGGMTTLADCVGWEPVPAALRNTPAADRILGGQAQLWTEYIADRKRLDYMAFPRLCALSEALWTSAAVRTAASFAPRLPMHLKLLDQLGVGYRRP
jgi:hexosaminidase